MNSEIAPSTTIAPIPIARALPPLNPLDPGVVVVVATVGVVVVGVLTDCGGTPGVNGFVEPLCASAAEGSASAPPARTATSVALLTPPDLLPCSRRQTPDHPHLPAPPTIRTLPAPPTMFTPPAPPTHYRSDASGCSIPGVPGASLYGCSGSTCSSWYTLSALTAQMS